MQIAAAVLLLLPISYHQLLNFGTFTLLNAAPLIYISYPHRAVLWNVRDHRASFNHKYFFPPKLHMLSTYILRYETGLSYSTRKEENC